MNEPTIEEVVGEFHAKVCRASGGVHDLRRLVQFLYLLMRDHVPCGMVGQVMLENNAATFTTDDPPKWEQVVIDRAARLHDAPTNRLRDFVHRARPLLSDAVWNDIDGKLSLRDDVDSTLTNGWLGLYAQWLAEELLSA